MPKRASEYVADQMHRNVYPSEELRQHYFVNITSSKGALLSWRFYIFLPSLDRARTS